MKGVIMFKNLEQLPKLLKRIKRLEKRIAKLQSN